MTSVVRFDDSWLRKVGSGAALGYGVTLLLALVMITPPFLSGPADAFEPTNADRASG